MAASDGSRKQKALDRISPVMVSALDEPGARNGFVEERIKDIETLEHIERFLSYVPMLFI